MVYMSLAHRLYIQFGWDVFRLVNASVEQKRILRVYQTMVSQLKLVAFFASAFCMAVSCGGLADAVHYSHHFPLAQQDRVVSLFVALTSVLLPSLHFRCSTLLC